MLLPMLLLLLLSGYTRVGLMMLLKMLRLDANGLFILLFTILYEGYK